jgi:hypothetical protein
VKKVEKDISPSSSKGQQAWNLSKAIKHWNLPLDTKLGTFQGPPNIETFH